MRVRTIFCAAVVAAGLAATAAAEEGMTLEVGEKITLKAEDLFLRQVLVELSEAVPFTLIERGETLDQPVSFDFEASDWADAISVLLRGKGYTLTTDSTTGQPKVLVVGWDVVGESFALAATGAPGDGDVEAKIRAAAELLKPRDHAADAIDAVAAARLALQVARQALLAANGNDPDGALAAAVAQAQAAYDEALGDLGNHDDERAVAALMPALDEDDRTSRLSALKALRWQSRTSRNADAVSRVAAAIETDDDPEVQRAALVVYVRYGDPDEVLQTIEPIALTKGPNQDLAVREWLRIREEQDAQKRMKEEGDQNVQFGVQE